MTEAAVSSTSRRQRRRVLERISRERFTGREATYVADPIAGHHFNVTCCSPTDGKLANCDCCW